MENKNAIEELYFLNNEKYLSLSIIEWWLLKYELLYNDTKEQINSIPSSYSSPRVGDRFSKLFQFTDLYELLKETSTCHRNEAYFAIQLKKYGEVSNNVRLLKEWHSINKLKNKEQLMFKGLFQNTSALKNYKFDLHLPIGIDFNISLNEFDFKNTLKFLDIIERSDKVKIIGVIKRIDDLEVFKERVIKAKEFIRTKPAFKRREILIDTKDENGSKHLVSFVNGKIELLNNLVIGQKIKIFASLRGHKVKNAKGDLEYQSYLIGWDIEKL